MAIQVLACFFLSQIQQTNDQPDLLWKFARHVSGALVIAQLPMLAFFVVLFPAGTVFRFMISVVCMIASVGLILAGDNFGRRPGILLPPISTILASIPLQLIGWTVPFFVHRAFSGWRLNSSDHQDETQHVSILTLLMTTAIIAIAFRFLTIGNQVLPMASYLGPILGLGCGFAFATPLTVLLLKSQRPRLALMSLCLTLGFVLTASYFALRFFVPKFATTNVSDSLYFSGLILVETMAITFGLFLIATRQAGIEFQIGKIK